MMKGVIPGFCPLEAAAATGRGDVWHNTMTVLDRRHFLQCMAWVGTCAVWTLSSGVLKGSPLFGVRRLSRIESFSHSTLL